jgi:hypothetical protein
VDRSIHALNPPSNNNRHPSFVAFVSPRHPKVESVTSIAVEDFPFAENEILRSDVAGPPNGGAMKPDIVTEFGASTAIT